MKTKRDDIDRLAERLWMIGFDASTEAGAGYPEPTPWKDAPEYGKAGWKAVAVEVTRMVEEAGK